MIDRIDQRIMPSLAAQAPSVSSKSVSPKAGAGFDFNRILQDSLSSQGREKQLELATIRLLYRTLEAILSEPETGESYLPPSPSLGFSSLNWPTLLSLQQDNRGGQGRELQMERAGDSQSGGVGASQAEWAVASQTEGVNVPQTAGAKVSPTNRQESRDIPEPAVLDTERMLLDTERMLLDTGRTAQDTGHRFQDSQGVESIIGESARKYNLDPSLIKAIIAVESAGNSRAVSSAGAQGLMQLMPATAAELGVTNPFDPVQNIMGGSRYLRQLLDRYQGNVRLALAAYNWGMGNLESRPNALPKETRNYIRRVEEYGRA